MLTPRLGHRDPVYGQRNVKKTGACGTFHSYILGLSLVYDGWEASGDLFWHFSVRLFTPFSQYTLTYSKKICGCSSSFYKREYDFELIIMGGTIGFATR